MTSETRNLRCAPWTRQQGVDPIGTAGSSSGFLLVELPLPWPARLESSPQLEPLTTAASAAGVRLQAVVPPNSDGRTRRLVLYRRDSGPRFRAYTRYEEHVAPGSVTAAAVRLLGDSRPAGDHGTDTVDVLVCTHGRRDICCGSTGTIVYAELCAGGSTLPPGARAWRTSHLGGHRFAPTALTLPNGLAWAFASAQLLRAVACREGDLASMLRHYRGSVAMPTPAAQALEREALLDIGWEWLDWEREAHDAGDGVIRLEGTAPDGRTATWHGHVTPGRAIPVPECGSPVGTSTKVETELSVTVTARSRGGEW